MRFSWKLFMWTISIAAATLAVGGYYIVNSFFRSALSAETKQALEENGILRFALETAALNVPSKYESLGDQTVARIGATLDTGGQSRYLRISGENSAALYESGGFCADGRILERVADGGLAHRITSANGRFYIQTAVKISVLDRGLYLETLRDITGVFEERGAGFAVYRKVCAVVLLCEGGIIFLLSRWLTRPVRLLSRAARNMAGGNYAYRAKKVGNDELGALTEDFNEMASCLEYDVERLEEAARSQEEFVGAFAHELKTPLTAIIGYADMLRSRRMDEETRMLSADYIYREGRRLEKLAFRLLDIIVLGRAEKPSASFRAGAVFEYLRDTFSKLDADLELIYDEREVVGDAALIKTLLSNLIDNSVKASEPPAKIEAAGEDRGGVYVFTVADHGRGIPPESLGRITEAFYTVDKSRSRSRHGAGLGLTLCQTIARLHGSELDIRSAPGAGTSVSFSLEVKY